MPAIITGPFLVAALLCERVLQEKDGHISVIRVFDRLMRRIEDEKPPLKMPAFTPRFYLFLSFKAGGIKGEKQVTIRSSSKEGTVENYSLSTPILFRGGATGNNVILDVSLKVLKEGLVWFDVILGKKTLTRIPLQIQYERVVQSQGKKREKG